MVGVSRETIAEIRGGIAQTWAIGIGVVPLGLAFGLVVAQEGYAWWWAPIFSFVIYAGSMEFLAIDLVSAGIGPVSAAVTGFMVNFRHIFYGLTFPRDAIQSNLGRVYSTYALTDESYAIVSAQPPGAISGTRVLTIQIFCQVLWIIPGMIGAAVGEVIPAGIIGMDFALTALFVVLAWESFTNNKDWSLPLTALALGLVAALLVPSQMLIAALVGYFLLLIARYRIPALDHALKLKKDEG